MKESWEKQKPKWFSDGTLKKDKQPGLLKQEYGSSRGKFYGLSPKCYHISDAVNIKRSNKGVPRHVNFAEREFEYALFGESKIKKKFGQIVKSKNYGAKCTREIEKKALNGIYLKMRTHDDLVTVTPLIENETYI